MRARSVLWPVIMTAIVVSAAAALPACSDSRAPSPDASKPASTFAVASPAFKDGEMIPAKYTGDGENVSPPLTWDKPPEGTASFAVIVDDPDAPVGTFTHWLICEIPADVRQLPEAIPTAAVIDKPISAMQGVNGFHAVGYYGPQPPKGATHRYYFKAYALDAKMGLAGGFSREQLLAAMKGHVLAEAQTMGRYKRAER